MHRGVPVGRTSLVELTPQYQEDPPLPAWISGFEPLPNYESIRTIVVRATQARAKFGFLGPVEDPESDRRGREAGHAYAVLMSQLEICDEQGRRLSVDNIQLWEGYRSGAADFTLLAFIDDAMATVVAKLAGSPRAGSDHEPPAA
jgi:hypothetical protein